MGCAYDSSTQESQPKGIIGVAGGQHQQGSTDPLQHNPPEQRAKIHLFDHILGCTVLVPGSRGQEMFTITPSASGST